MNSNRKSQAKSSTSCQFSIFLILAFSLGGCASHSPSNRAPEFSTDVPPEVSLKQDRSQLAELRKDIPADTQEKNDELAFILNLLDQPGADKEPSDIRDKFDDVVEKKREKFNDETEKQRDDFNASEKKARDAFLNQMNKDREKFYADHHTRDEIHDFSEDQEAKRKDYFGNERDRRKDFESEMREKRQNFNDYMRERISTFNEKYQAYSRQFYERQRELALKKTMYERQLEHNRTSSIPGTSFPGDPQPNVNPADMDSFSKIPQGQGVELGN